MTRQELKTLTSGLPEISELIKKEKILVKQVAKVRRRLKTQLNIHGFLETLVAQDASGNDVVIALHRLFIALELDSELPDDKYGEEDLRLWFKKKLILVEVTGTDKRTNTEAKAHQISKHIPLKQKKFPGHDVSGLFVSNHDNSKSFSERNEKPFEKRLIEIASHHSYTVTTTVQILNAYLMIRKGNLSLQEFVEGISSPGEFKI